MQDSLCFSIYAMCDFDPEFSPEEGEGKMFSSVTWTLMRPSIYQNNDCSVKKYNKCNGTQ